MKLLSLGCKKFNMDPKKGVEFLVQNRIIEGGPGAVAQVVKREWFVVMATVAKETFFSVPLPR